MKQEKFSSKNWICVVLFSLLGQIAWAIENQFLNLFIDRTISTSAFAISFMVSISAVVATVTTLFVGIKIDRIGKRAPFMTWGYILWGISIMAFSLITVDNMKSVFHLGDAHAVTLAVIFVIALDCVMTFIGSSANDAAFNAWVTDNTTTSNRSKVESILTIMGAAGMGSVFVFDLFTSCTRNTYYDAQGNVVNSIAQGGRVEFGNWTLFFCFFGVLVLAIGLIGKVFLKDSKDLKPNKQSSYKNVLYGFKPSVIKENKIFYLCLLATAIVGIAGNVTFPYLLIYMERTLGFKDYIIPCGIAVGSAMLLNVLFGAILDKKGNKEKYLILSLSVVVIGNILMLLASPLLFDKTPIIFFVFSLFILCLGGVLTTIILNSAIRDFTPKKSIGQFQGVRMFFAIMLPMCIGPFVTAFLNISGISNEAGIDAFGNVIRNYSPLMFLISALIVLLAFIPSIMIIKSIAKHKEK